MAYPASSDCPARPAYYEPDESDSGALVKVVALMLGVAVGVLVPLAIWLGASAHDARDDARSAAERTATAAPAPAAHEHAAAGGVATPSFAGLAPANADAIAEAHKPYPAELPALAPDSVVDVRLGIRHQTLEIAPGISYQTWTFGTTAPSPVIHVRQGQTVRVTMTNESPMPHSIDFHAARIAPNVAFADIALGKSFTFSFNAGDPGVYMYHCGTKCPAPRSRVDR